MSILREQIFPLRPTRTAHLFRKNSRIPNELAAPNGLVIRIRLPNPRSEKNPVRMRRYRKGTDRHIFTLSQPNDQYTAMHLSLEHIRTMEDLRSFIHHTLCQRENLLADQFGTSESRLVKGGEECGRQYSLRGPRSVKLSAIWSSEQNQIFFYGANGERYLKVKLPQQIGSPLPAFA